MNMRFHLSAKKIIHISTDLFKQNNAFFNFRFPRSYSINELSFCNRFFAPSSFSIRKLIILFSSYIYLVPRNTKFFFAMLFRKANTLDMWFLLKNSFYYCCLPLLKSGVIHLSWLHYSTFILFYQGFMAFISFDFSALTYYNLHKRWFYAKDDFWTKKFR